MDKTQDIALARIAQASACIEVLNVELGGRVSGDPSGLNDETLNNLAWAASELLSQADKAVREG
ncbi:MAG: hypothetical protein WC830_10115 [Burkholderiales bacterium]|jgi:hypothetical protein